jgi:toxin-antitoxin system PIN domain toxin
MLLPDVNILVYAYNTEAADHSRFREWLRALANGQEAFGLADIVCSGFLRIVTHPRLFDPPATISEAFGFVERLRSRPNCMVISPGPRHWSIFSELCRTAGARGNLVPDAYLAALAIESGSEWITTDGDFARFPGLRWRRPFAP